MDYALILVGTALGFIAGAVTIRSLGDKDRERDQALLDERISLLLDEPITNWFGEPVWDDDVHGKVD